MAGWFDVKMEHWRHRAAIRAEHTLEPTLRRRLDRFPDTWAARRSLRAERRARPRSTSDIDAAIGRQWGRVRQGR